MKYETQYRYRLTETITEPVGLDKYRVRINRYLHLNLVLKGLVIHKGYSWDGPSGPAIDTENLMRASLVHDALYQLIREGQLPKKVRRHADKLFYRIARKDGVSWWRANYMWGAVRLFGGRYV